MRRIAVGILAIGCLVAAAMVWLLAPGNDLLLASLLRLGSIFAVLWLALPDVERGQTLYVLGWLFLCALVLMMKPRLLPIVLVIWLLTWMLRPRGRSGPR